MKKLINSFLIAVTAVLVVGIVWFMATERYSAPIQISEHRYIMNPSMPSVFSYMKDGGMGLTLAFTQTGVSGLGNAASVVTGTYANSQADTFVFNREKGISALSFAVHCKDSFQLGGTTAGKVVRLVDGVITAAPGTDTLTNFTNLTSTSDGSTAQPWVNGRVALGAITTAPICDQYWVILTYAASGNGTTTPNYKVEFIKQYSYL